MLASYGDVVQGQQAVWMIKCLRVGDVLWIDNITTTSTICISDWFKIKKPADCGYPNTVYMAFLWESSVCC